MRRVVALAVAVVLIGQASAIAQLKAPKQSSDFGSKLRQPAVGSPLGGIFGFDPAKFRMQHSYTLSVTSFGGHTFTQGLYLNTMTYQFSPKLVAQLQLGMLHQPLGGPAFANAGNRFFVSRAQILFRPTKNMRLYFQYGTYPYGSYYERDPYYWNRPIRGSSFWDEDEPFRP